MAVYPFYVEADSSSRRSLISGGVRSKDGTMTTKIYQRDNGAITIPFEIRQYTETRDGILVCVTRVYFEGDLLKEHVTQY